MSKLLLFSIAALTVLIASSAEAQIRVEGGSRNDVLSGSAGGDIITDTAGPGDVDILQDDSERTASDGEHDMLVTRDGDGHDEMHGGPEDKFVGDPDDIVHIYDQNWKELWVGRFEEYQRIKRLIAWIKSLFQTPSGPIPPGVYWGTSSYAHTTIGSIRDSLEVADSLCLSEYFELEGLGYTGSPEILGTDFGQWFPWNDVVLPVEPSDDATPTEGDVATEGAAADAEDAETTEEDLVDMCMNSEEFDAALEAALFFLSLADGQVADSQ
ncbi:MAG: hypothetical protein AAF488_12885 [Planctomycetota bacterium]